MAWRSSGTSNEALIENLARNKLITSSRVKQAMLQVDRAHFAPTAPYQDSPQALFPHPNATISAPHMHAAACEALLPYLHPSAAVLDVGSGSGYLTLVLAQLVAPGGRVTGVEHVAALAELGRRNVGRSGVGREMLGNGKVGFVHGDGRLGWRQGAPWDAIHVGAAAKEVHEELLGQLKAPGRLFIPVEEEDGLQHIYIIDKKEDGTLTKLKDMGVRYVPLTDAPKEGT